MPRNSFHFAALIAAGLILLPAPRHAQAHPAQDSPNVVIGIAISDVAGAPFSATAVIQFQRDLGDEGMETLRTISLIARDTTGRTHNETRRFMPEYFHGSPLLMGVRLYDPHTRIRTSYDPALHIAHRQLYLRDTATNREPRPDEHIQDLGTITLNGLPAKGTRRTTVIPKKESGVGEKVTVEDEEWYSEDLHIALLIRHSDPRVGTETIGISNLKREEPDASMFQVPPGYQIVDVDPARHPAPRASEVPEAPPDR